MGSRQIYPPMTIEVICDECSKKLGSVPMSRHYFLHDVYELRRQHAAQSHGIELRESSKG